MENPVFLLSNLEISAALWIYQPLKDIGSARKISRKGDHMDGVVRHTHRKMALRGLKTRRMDWREKQDPLSV